jgi:hypothetical protein
MKTNLNNFFFLLLITWQIGHAQEVAPLMTDNVWIYDFTTSEAKITILDTIKFIDTIKYFQTMWQANYGGLWGFEFIRLQEDGYYAIREDTSYQAPNNELLYYKENAVIGDTWTQPDRWSPFDAVYTIEDTFVVNVFGEPTTVKRLTIDSGLSLFEEYWTEKFGKLSRTDFGTPISSLRGCVIDGVAYGDTSFNVVSVKYETGHPKNFILKQNYPNPFNPATTIVYSIPYDDQVTLKLYDVLGNEIAVLVNEVQTKGFHTINLNASNLASGIYFYTLTSGEFKSSKKLILIK